MAREWSEYQQAIFKFVKTQSGNAIVEAVAGSGKTTTIVEAFSYCGGSSVFLAFNKAIAKELCDRGVNAKTFHGLCYVPVLKGKPGRVMDEQKTIKIFRETYTDEKVQEMYMYFVKRLVGLGKQNGLDCLRPNSEENWNAIIEHHDLELDHEEAQMAMAVEMAKNILNLSNAHPTMFDYDDMLYLAVRDGLKLPKFKFVFVDEAQDTNAIQRAILKKILLKQSRLFAVGDPAQAIYGFRGADSDSMNKIEEEFKCARLPLTITYRCPQTVVKHAQQWVKHIECAPTAPAGEVRQLNEQWKPEDFAANDMVVCRTTRPLVALGYSMLKARKPFFIMGKNIGEGLAKLITKQKARDIDSLSKKLEAWMTREVEKALVKDDQAKVEAIQDKYDAIMALIADLPEGKRTVNELLYIINLLFADNKSNATVLCTIHKSKGLERDRVWWLNSSQCPAKWASGWQYKQEENLCYVATTRAKTQLNLIEEKKEN